MLLLELIRQAGKQCSNCITGFDQAFALMTPSTTTDDSTVMYGPDSLDQTFEEFLAPDFALTRRSQNSSPARQCPIMNFPPEQYGNGKQSAALEFASSPASSDNIKSWCMPNSPAISSNLNSPCQCLPRALSILADLEVGSFHYPPMTKEDSPDHSLKCLRRCLQRCSEILECKILTWTSEFFVLLIVISRNMLDAFDRLDSSSSHHHHNRDQQQQQQQQASHKWNFPPLCSLGKYDLESPEEIQCLMNWLVLIQIKGLATFLARLKKITEEYDWAERHQSLLSLLGQSCLQLVRRLKRRDFIFSTVDDDTGETDGRLNRSANLSD